MIFYFSGTGNSKWIAEKIGQKIGEEALDISKLISEGLTDYQPKAEETVGLVFPVYAWGAPEVVYKFAKNIKLKPNNYSFAVCNCASEAGLSLENLKKVFSIKSGFSIIMPNNYLLMGADVDDSEKIEQKLAAANSRIIGICQHIAEKEEMMDCYKGSMAFLKSKVFHFFFNKFARSTKSFTVEETCDGCGICCKFRTCDNIVLENNKPVWKGKCHQCFSCINRCPKKAIQYGSKTKTTGRYYLEEKYLANLKN